MFRAIWVSIQLEEHFLLFPHALIWIQICAFTLQFMCWRSLYNICLGMKQMAFKVVFTVIITASKPKLITQFTDWVFRKALKVLWSNYLSNQSMNWTRRTNRKLWKSNRNKMRQFMSYKPLTKNSLRDFLRILKETFFSFPSHWIS